MIHIERSTNLKVKPAQEKLGFGQYFTDHMFMLDYDVTKGWHDARIVPYQPITLDPAAKVFHYGQTIFEGLKAYRGGDSRIRLFRPEANIARMNRSNVRMSVPQLDSDQVLAALEKLIEVDAKWIPSEPGTSLYIRPFVFATQPVLGVAPSEQYQFIIIMSPVGAYYPEGINPVRIFVESEHVRASVGGVGEAKTAGNYAATFMSQQTAKEAGYTQVMWLDSAQHRFIEEVGSMNVFFRIDGKVCTPALSGSILAGITRSSIIQLLASWGIAVEERTISIEELYEAGREGRLEEAFGTGTAAVVSPIGELCWQGERLIIGESRTGELAKRLYDALTGIQYGTVEDTFGWVKAVDVQAALV
ncbi:branched-chain amino acid aminotransferase [Paenibacillus taihuensis]|uniref:Branched-chain-amino-acid aminotransferase n=1 Tax=Paenibacillus taihuensis TaxID=1156355 RepID=A0A3D9S510_9BACL|nr:branched-chain amino acid aminotransferase [Paenibacillus taihuensis]